MMYIEVLRYNGKSDFTDSVMRIDGETQCFGIEDEKRTTKVWGETRIDNGVYFVELKTHGGFHNRYSKKFPDMHVGMLQIMDVPKFKDVLIHVGNDDDDTAGCYLVGMAQNMNDKGFLGESMRAYKKIYPKIAKALSDEEVVQIEFKEW